MQVVAFVLPMLRKWIDQTPRGFDFVSTGEQGRVTSDRVQKEAFVCFRKGCCAEGVRVVELHVYRAHL
jgi:hypothetical protein